VQWLRNRRRKAVAAAPFPRAWQEVLEHQVMLYSLLSDEEKTKLHRDIAVFASEKSWEGCGGQEITDAVKVVISAHACLLTLNIEHNFYPNLESILVYPSGYTSVSRKLRPGGFVEEGISARIGEAWSSGPVILSWEDVLAGSLGHSGANNVTLHEFAHKLDMLSGGADGVPELDSNEAYETWADVMSWHYEQMLLHIHHHGHSYLNPYAATSPAEFFAVAVETFFMRPLHLLPTMPSLYGVLRSFFKQDPAAAAVLALHLRENPLE
jgi:MtfA peptidase